MRERHERRNCDHSRDYQQFFWPGTSLRLSRSILLLLAVCLMLNIVKEVAAQGPAAEPGEIMVTAEAPLRIEAQTVRVTFLVEATGGTASEAFNSMRAKSRTIAKEIKLISDNLDITKRGEELSNAAKKGAPITHNAAVRATRYIAVQTGETKKTSRIIDVALKAGASSVTEVKYLAEHSGKENQFAIREATKQARLKALQVAESLGVKLGRLLSATVTEEPVGALLRKKLQQGVAPATFSERDETVYVNVRYAIRNQ